MIFGDEIILNKEGFIISNKALETIGIYEGCQVHILPLRTFESREEEPGYTFDIDFLLSPISPEKWPFVMRFELHLRNRPGVLSKALEFFAKQDINILFSECTRSGHHHEVLNLVGELKRLENRTLLKMYEELLEYREQRQEIYENLYDYIYKDRKGINTSKSWGKIIEHVFQTESGEKKFFTDPFWWHALRSYANKDGKLIDDNEIEKSLKIVEKTSIRKQLKYKKKLLKNFHLNIKHSKSELEYLLTQIEKLIKSTTDENKRDVLFEVHAKLKGKELDYIDRVDGNKKMTIQELLEKLIIKNKPEVLKISRNEKYSPEEKYIEIERIMVLPKLVLTIILEYKRMLCEKYKLLLIFDSLEGISDSIDKDIVEQNDTSEIYLYNMRYYRSVFKYPFFNEKAVFNSSVNLDSVFELNEEKISWDEITKRIILKLNNLKPDRKSLWIGEPRYDLDPIFIAPIEYLCHAAYHRVYESSFFTFAKNSFIPFPEYPYKPNCIIDEVLVEDNSSTIAISSRNTDSLTMRLCPIPTNKLSAFKKIDIDSYERKCQDVCVENARDEFRDIEMFQFRNFEPIPHICNKDKNCKNSGDNTNEKNNIDEENNVLREGNNTEKDNENLFKCNTTSNGMIFKIAESITSKILEDDCPNTSYKMNIWRAYDKTFKLSEHYEHGGIHFITQGVGKNFGGFDENLNLKTKELIKCTVNKISPSNHIKVDDVRVSSLSGGQIFVSMPLTHAMSKEWLECVRKIGREYGFAKIDTVESYTQSITPLVARKIKESHAMIQIIALEEPAYRLKEEKYKPPYDKLAWIHAEYLAAINQGLKVIRLVDESSIDFDDFRIGRDHAAMHFYANKPFNQFEEVVRKAYQFLIVELSSKLGLG
ncbi:MAG: hypothetical protein AB2L26_11160 [Ignavibacteria bacterium]